MSHEEFQLLKSTADGGDVEAMYRLGEVYQFGDNEAKVTRDLMKAEKYFKMAADLGNIEGMCKYADFIGSFAPELAGKYYKKAADLGSMEGMYKYGCHLIFV